MARAGCGDGSKVRESQKMHSLQACRVANYEGIELVLSAIFFFWLQGLLNAGRLFGAAVEETFKAEQVHGSGHTVFCTCILIVTTHALEKLILSRLRLLTGGNW